jgi:hypothetical protein
MKRLIYCVMAALLAVAPGLCFGQAIGEMMQIQPKAPAVSPSMPGNMTFSGQTKIRRRVPSTSGGVINMGKTHYELPAKTSSTGQAQPVFTIHGGDADDAQDSPAQSTKPQAAAPSKVENVPAKANNTPTPAPPS